MYNKGKKLVYLFFKSYFQVPKFIHIMNESKSIASREGNCIGGGMWGRKFTFTTYFCAF